MKITKLNIRGLSYHIQEWGDASKPLLVLLHGWMDCGATFQYVVNELADSYRVVAPDLRGFGQTQHAQGYWFPDYFADLETLLDVYTPDQPARLVGHSMGGNIVLMYAGIRPERVASVLSLEGLGMNPTSSIDAPAKYRNWMNEILSGEASKIYPNVESLKRSIHKGNPTLANEMIEALVEHWGEPIDENGAYRLKHDHQHRFTNPVRYNFDEVLQIWSNITARVGVVMAEQSRLYSHFEKIGRIAQAKDVLNINDEDYFVLPDSAHMLHLEQPQATAECVKRFFTAS